jgi:ureidoglycolate dehydrogenase (NAD+)
MDQKMINGEKLKRFSKKALVQAGMSPADAKIVAEVMVTNDMRGTYTHGSNGLRGFIKHIQGGGMNPKANISVLKEGPSYALVDGNAGSGILTSYKSMKLAIKKARKTGIAVVSVRNSMHFGAAGYYSIMCAQEGMIGIAMGNSYAIMAATGSAERVIGNSPFSYAVPWDDHTAVSLDIAMSVVSGMKIVTSEKEGKNIPDGWLVDHDGNPTTNPADFMRGAREGGALMPVGGYKGYGLAVMVESLAGILSGAAITTDIKSWNNSPDLPSDEGHLFIAIDVDKIMPLDLFKQRMNILSDRITHSKKAAGVDRIYMPGEKEIENEAKAREAGFYPGDSVMTNLRAVAEEFGMTAEFKNLNQPSSPAPGKKI